MPHTAALLVVGDVDQLPSVGPGQVLADIIASEAIPAVRNVSGRRRWSKLREWLAVGMGAQNLPEARGLNPPQRVSASSTSRMR
jgi:ATP-dependent exoDNAse (exonuclease V) alpha subunit